MIGRLGIPDALILSTLIYCAAWACIAWRARAAGVKRTARRG